MINKRLLFILLLLGNVALASADYNDAMHSFEEQEYRQALRGFSSLAVAGDADAQYMLGRLYEAGNGTPQDFVAAHKWYNIAASRGHRHAAAARDAVATRMTRQQIADAQQAARAWQPGSVVSPEASTSVEMLSDRERVAGIQRELNQLGYDAGPADGLIGSRTRNAIRDYQGTVGLPQDGLVTTTLLERLRNESSSPAPSSSAEQAMRAVLEDSFRDGDFRRDPAWTVLSGRFDVDDRGLRSIVQKPRAVGSETPTEQPRRREEELGLAVLQLILEQAGGLPPRATETTPVPEVEFAEPARIFVEAPVGNDFALEMELASYQRPGSLELGVFQGSQPGGGYRLVYNPGARPGLSLVRLTSEGGEVIASSEGTLDLEDGRFHTLNWSRNVDGGMEVRVDGRRVIQARDLHLRQGFRGFVLVNYGGEYSLRRVRLDG
ncbi:hypothetical protein BOX17_00995 [Halomonas aestuarii]|uniref:Peptidoglycan binding-like domain-containing protein n=1 Tax=Halomonas aestuarii TaxID=1897729 RepID=A0A1J0VCC2_9GAMM|nr:peptidoglycan-binding protein [Halomonas aestuarii]APE29655.1 hypothetical protein BOX17_00995 [Halomonas aestuarii]